jgi:hypothetical protein
LAALVLAALVVGFVFREDTESERQQRSSVALFLYGQDDPDGITAPGLHGLGGDPVRVIIQKVGSCRW